MNDELHNTLDKVVPRIYVALPDSSAVDIQLTAEDSPVERRLTADLIIFYAFDAGDHYVIIANRELKRLGIAKEALHERAIENLRAMNLDIRAHKGDRITMLTAGGNYEATLLLLPEVWESVQPMVAGQIIVSVPARDVLYFTGDAIRDDLADLRRWTSQAIEHADKPLSRTFLCWKGSNWETYEGFAA